MPLSQPNSRRALRHTRAITVQAFARDDGLWDLDAHINDTKTRDTKLASGIRAAGEPVHDLHLRVTIDTHMTIVAAEAVSDAVPYPGFCDTIGPSYDKLIGLNLARGFRKGLMDRLGGISGCTHLTELGQALPTAAFQAFAGDVIVTNDDAHGQKPFELDHCHALRTDGTTVAQYYPRWFVGPAKKQQSS